MVTIAPAFDNKIHSPEIADALKAIFSRSEISAIREIHSARANGEKYPQLFAMASALDVRIGGDGRLEIICFRRNHHDHTGNYRDGYRDVFRPLQYAIRDCFATINWPIPRGGVMWSCGHVESVLKRRFEDQLKGIENLPMGTIIQRVERKGRLLDQSTIATLRNINSAFCIAKHDFSDESVPDEYQDDPNTPTFNLLEAMATFFICRKMGMVLNPSLAALASYEANKTVEREDIDQLNRDESPARDSHISELFLFVTFILSKITKKSDCGERTLSLVSTFMAKKTP